MENLEQIYPSPKIITVQHSPRKNKRLRVYLQDGEYFDFGLKDGSTYVDHQSKAKRLAYWARHTANPRERELINNLTPSPALYSAYILWGLYPSIQDNIDYLNSIS